MHTYMITTTVRWIEARGARTSAAGFHISLRLFSAMKVGHGTIPQQNEKANGSFIKRAGEVKESQVRNDPTVNTHIQAETIQWILR